MGFILIAFILGFLTCALGVLFALVFDIGWEKIDYWLSKLKTK